MNTSDISAWSAVIALALTAISVTFTGLQVARFRKDLRHQTEVALYSYIFEWDRLLIEHPELSRKLLRPSPGATLSLPERRLAEYRLDLAEFAFLRSKGDLYDADPDFFIRLIGIPLIRKAILSGQLEGSLRPEFLTRCVAAARTAPPLI